MKRRDWSDTGEPTQPTQPKGIDPKTGKPYEPVQIPIPKRDDVLGDLERAAKPKKDQAE